VPLEKRPKDLRGFFLPDKADDAGVLSPGKEDNAVRRKKNRKDWTVFKWRDYIAKERVYYEKKEYTLR